MLRPVNLSVSAFVQADAKTIKTIYTDTQRIDYRTNMPPSAQITVTDALKFSADVYGEYSSHVISTVLVIPISDKDLQNYDELVVQYYDRASWWMKTAANRIFEWQGRPALFDAGDKPEVVIPELYVDTAEEEPQALLEVGSDMTVSQAIHGLFSSQTLGLRLRGPLAAKQVGSFERVADRIFDRVQLTLMKKMNQIFESRGKAPFFEVNS